jgi:hypothetical protein
LESIAGISVLILPNYGALSDAQASSLRRFVQTGGALIATGRSSLYDEWGQPRPDFALADLLGCHYVALGREGERPRESRSETLHTYLRIGEASPLSGAQSRHEILRGFDETEILPFGGWLGDVTLSDEAEALLTYVPSFPIYPPETSWMREPRTKIPGLILNAKPQKGRVVFLVADLDRRFATDNLPDHGRLLSNLVRWAANGRFPVEIEGPGLIDCRLYRQESRLILHLVNLTSTEGSRGPVDELVPVGPVKVRFNELPALRYRHVHLLVGREKPSVSFDHHQSIVVLPSLLDHEVVVLG